MNSHDSFPVVIRAIVARRNDPLRSAREWKRAHCSWVDKWLEKSEWSNPITASSSGINRAGSSLARQGAYLLKRRCSRGWMRTSSTTISPYGCMVKPTPDCLTVPWKNCCHWSMFDQQDRRDTDSQSSETHCDVFSQTWIRKWTEEKPRRFYSIAETPESTRQAMNISRSFDNWREGRNTVSKKIIRMR